MKHTFTTLWRPLCVFLAFAAPGRAEENPPEVMVRVRAPGMSSARSAWPQKQLEVEKFEDKIVIKLDHLGEGRIIRHPRQPSASAGPIVSMRQGLAPSKWQMSACPQDWPRS